MKVETKKECTYNEGGGECCTTPIKGEATPREVADPAVIPIAKEDVDNIADKLMSTPKS